MLKNKVKKYMSKFENRLFEKFAKNEINKFIKNDFNLEGYRFFSDIKDIEDWGSKYSNYYQNLIKLRKSALASKEQLEELNYLDKYCGYNSIYINDHLREKKENEYFNEGILKMDTYINKFILKENIIVVRRMPNKFLDKKYKKNSLFIENGFLSTSLNLLHRLNINCEYRPLQNETLLIIKVPKGIRGIYIGQALPTKKKINECEFLISRNQTLKVEYNRRVFSNRLIKLQIIHNKN